nr:hypothetical protein [Planococcus glaciei]
MKTEKIRDAGFSQAKSESAGLLAAAASLEQEKCLFLIGLRTKDGFYERLLAFYEHSN